MAVDEKDTKNIIAKRIAWIIVAIALLIYGVIWLIFVLWDPADIFPPFNK